MKHSRYSIVPAAVLALVLALAMNSHALTISQISGYGYNTATGTWNLQPCAWGVDILGTVDNSKALAFNKFDSSLGTLVSAELKFYTSANGILSVTNQSVSTMTIWDLINGVVVSYQVPALGEHFNRLESNSFATVNNSLSLAGGATYTSADVPLSPFLSPDRYLYDQASVAPFVGTAGSTLTIPIGADNYSTINYGGGNSVISFFNDAGVYATLDYTYEATSVPEPATVILLGAPFGLLVWRRRRHAEPS